MTQKDEKTQKEIDSSVLGTAKIDPNENGSEKNTNPLDRIKYAIGGLLHLVYWHSQFTYIIAGTVIVLILAGWLGITVAAWGLLVLNIGQLWIAEVFNSSIEALTDLVTEGEIRTLAKVAKDVAATGSLVSSIVFLIVSCLLLLPPLLARF